ncbi:PREDICTED: cysteine-rich secretory protein LCCL domain-containing 2-like [Nanorana parkeri]|uniref:cysteine-rich secretory protein LCCL domain-containing 2-like n=1 Tax=Nanorana parkeri TaxID=125878 RepID=UPI0008548924|nr:PREDICTED: cysteine-rich secretory protein LCCL domain-containing 2-like [Nanorana parkeri]
MSLSHSWFLPLTIVLLVDQCHGLFLPNNTFLENFLSKYSNSDTPHSRSRRAILKTDKEEILQLHNKLRGQVHPPASNMEFMTWDEELERSSEAWAQECMWEHGPTNLLMSIGQNLAVHWGRPPLTHLFHLQIVWATTTKVGCAVNNCKRMNVWGEIWENAVYLVCSFYFRGNWIGEAPYKTGRPCSECPPSYGGNCKNNLCYKAQVIKCETKMRDKCKASTCNRPKAGHFGEKFGSCSFDVSRLLSPHCDFSYRLEMFNDRNVSAQMSSLCRAAIHYGAIDNNGGLSLTQLGRARVLSSLSAQTVDCYSTVAEICPFEKPAKHCPSFQTSSICRTAVHAGALKDEVGGYVDVMPVDRKNHYLGSNKNGIHSESFKNRKEGKSFRIFAVKQ